MVRTIFEMKEMPIPMACDMYDMMVDSLEEESVETYNDIVSGIDFIPQINKEESAFTSWRDTVNDLYFSGSFVDMFKENSDDPWPIEALWVAYYCLGCIVACLDENGEAGDLQVFKRNGKKFWVKSEAGQRVVFLLPEDY